MIYFNYETDFQIGNEDMLANWIKGVVSTEGFDQGEINYIFCDDDYLHKLNLEFLNHDTLTDIISFDYTMGKIIQGDVFISIERVSDNAKQYEASFEDELHRVMVHGVLHYCGYKDKKLMDKKLMREKENYYIKQLAQFQ